MNYRRLGSSGLKLSELAFGSWVTFGRQMDEDLAWECMTAAYESGVNFFDNAEAYGRGQAETIMGSVLKKAGWPRVSYVVSTKFYWGLSDKPTEHNTLNRKHLMDGIAGSLKRLQLDYVDLIFCHRPDPETPIEETVRAMDDIIHRGMALYWGTSEWTAAQIMEAYGLARQYGLYPPQMEQPQYHMLHRERVEKEYARLYKGIGLGLTTYSPLAAGILTGKYNDGIPGGSRASLPNFEWFKNEITPDKIQKVKQLQPIAADLGCSMAQLALAWCLKNPNVSTVVTGASRPAQLVENLRATEVAAQLADEIGERIEQILQNKPQPDEV